jgi:hypothetical protein
MRLRLLRIDRERAAELVKAADRSGPSEADLGTFEFGAPDRSDETIKAERERAGAAKKATNGMLFLTEEWVIRAQAHADRARAEQALDAVNAVLDPAEPEKEEAPRKPEPRWLHRVGVKEERKI